MAAVSTKRQQELPSSHLSNGYLRLIDQTLRRHEMNVLVTRMALAASVALATLFVAAGANAQAVYAQRDRGEAYDAQMNPQYRFGPRVHVQPNDVVSGHSVIGRDPDPFVRDQLLREFNSGRQD